MKKQDYNEVDEQAKDNKFCACVILPLLLIALIGASVWTYVNWLNAL